MSLLTPQEYAKKKGYHKATVYRWVADGNIPTVYINKPMPFIDENAEPLKKNVKRK